MSNNDGKGKFAPKCPTCGRPMKRERKISAERIKLIVDLHEHGFTYAQIAQTTKLSTSNVGRIVRGEV